MRRTILLLAATLAAPLAAASDEDDACGAILCLAGKMKGASGGNQCRPSLTRYFQIEVKHHGDFSPERTAERRLDFLKQCPDASGTAEQVNSRYGTRRGL